MRKLSKMLSEWTDNNLLTAEQAQKIIQYENSQDRNSWLVYGFMVLGATVIAVGIISLIAANWKNIPDWGKLTADFALLSTAGWGAYYAWKNKKEILFEVFLVFFVIACLASIGLISQIYHTGGKPHQALLFWAIITFGAVAVSKRVFVPMVWAAGLILGCAIACFESVLLHGFFDRRAIQVAMFIPLLCSFFAIAFQRFFPKGSQGIALWFCAAATGIIAMGMADFSRSWFTKEYLFVAYLPSYVFASMSMLGLHFISDIKYKQKGLLTLLVILYLLPFHYPYFGIDFLRTRIVDASMGIICLGLLAVILASLKQRLLFQIMLIMMGGRFVALYFEALGGLALTGIGLIISGMLIIGLVIVWNRYRKRVSHWAEGLMQ